MYLPRMRAIRLRLFVLHQCVATQKLRISFYRCLLRSTNSALVTPNRGNKSRLCLQTCFWCLELTLIVLEAFTTLDSSQSLAPNAWRCQLSLLYLHSVQGGRHVQVSTKSKWINLMKGCDLLNVLISQWIQGSEYRTFRS